MSYESTEERIERLENIVKNQSEMLSRILPLLDALRLCDARLGQLIAIVNEQQLQPLRVMASNPAFGDAAYRQILTDGLARAESTADQLAAMLNSLDKPLPPETPPGDLPPPAPEG